jgi:hypothetical protein
VSEERVMAGTFAPAPYLAPPCRASACPALPWPSPPYLGPPLILGSPRRAGTPAEKGFFDER